MADKHPPDTENPTLLVVDDNDMNRDMLSRRLEKKGYAVRTAPDGQSALAVLAREPIGLILLDIEMPGMSGLDVLREVRETYNAVELPVIMATARSDSADVVGALDSGANDYVTKPLDFPVVLARVESQLRTRKKAMTAAPPPSDDGELGPGKVIAGKYELEARIGSGAFGTVYRARHQQLKSEMAVKVLQAAAARSPEALERFQREGIAACRIKHPNAVAVLDFGTTAGGAGFLVMELLSGRGLEDELAKAGRLHPVRAAEIIRCVCDVLGEAHKAGIVHRDIKPANVFLHRTVHGEVVKVLDFGIAKLVDDDAKARNLTVDGAIIGTPAYMAPERFRGQTPSGSSDVYSVGVMLYQMLTGRLPFVAPEADLVAIAMMHINREPAPLRSLDPSIPAALERVVNWALAKNEAARPTATQFAAGLSHAVGLDPQLPVLYLSPRHRHPEGAGPLPAVETGATTRHSPVEVPPSQEPPTVKESSISTERDSPTMTLGSDKSGDSDDEDGSQETPRRRSDGRG